MKASRQRFTDGPQSLQAHARYLTKPAIVGCVFQLPKGFDSQLLMNSLGELRTDVGNGLE